MDQKCDKLYPSAPLEIFDLEQRLEKKLNDFNILKTISITLKT